MLKSIKNSILSCQKLENMPKNDEMAKKITLIITVFIL